MVRKCTSRGIAKIAVMEVAQVGVRTRARAALAMATKAAVAASSVTEKRRKVTGSTTTKGELVKLSTSYVELRSRKRVVIASENLVIPATAESNIGVRTAEEEVEERCTSPNLSDRDVQASCCSSNGSSEIADGDNDDQKRIEFVDLEVAN